MQPERRGTPPGARVREVSGSARGLGLSRAPRTAPAWPPLRRARRLGPGVAWGNPPLQRSRCAAEGLRPPWGEVWAGEGGGGPGGFGSGVLVRERAGCGAVAACSRVLGSAWSGRGGFLVGRRGVLGLGLAVFEPRHATFAEVRFETERAEWVGLGYSMPCADRDGSRRVRAHRLRAPVRQRRLIKLTASVGI